jgi:hypothetical protein
LRKSARLAVQPVEDACEEEDTCVQPVQPRCEAHAGGAMFSLSVLPGGE